MCGNDGAGEEQAGGVLAVYPKVRLSKEHDGGKAYRSQGGPEKDHFNGRQGNQLAEDSRKPPQEHDEVKFEIVACGNHQRGTYLYMPSAMIAKMMLGIHTEIWGGMEPVSAKVRNNMKKMIKIKDSRKPSAI